MLAPGAARGTAGPLRRLFAQLTPAGRDAPDCGRKLTATQQGVLAALRDGPAAATSLGVDHGTLRRLAARELIALERRTVARRPSHHPIGARLAAPPELTAQQAEVLAQVSRPLAECRHERLLLHGVTGSGKTEIYLRAAAQTLAQGRGAIVLVPEIGLTPQLVGRFCERLGDTVAVLHSDLSAGERHDEWRRLRDGDARVCVGPRSAVFAPIADLGLIVVDEEHEASYKHEGDPRYDAREVAAHRAEQAGAVLLCGSATPRPESRHRLRRLALTRRVDGRALPDVELLDMRGVRHGLHERTAEALADVRRARGKAIVLLNRRGWSNFLVCGGCGRVWSCPNCDVALVLHRAQDMVACHHCGHREPAPSRCNECGSLAVSRHGAGTERLEHELARILDDGTFPILRLDADTAAARGGAAAQLRRFQDAPAAALIGTQMVAKGHDFPDVSLAVVLDADATLRFPDFRAQERTFALICQLAGRAGRGGAGRVLVQTTAPESDAIVRAAAHDSEGFLTAELERRAALRYPPFSHLIRVVCASERPEAAIAAAIAVRRGLALDGESVLGPATLFRLRGRDRAQIVIKAADRPRAVREVGEAVAAVAATSAYAGVALSVDVDPQ